MLIQRTVDVFLLIEADEVDSEGSTEPPHKRLCLSEDDQSIDDSTPCISVVAVPSKSLNVNQSVWLDACSCTLGTNIHVVVVEGNTLDTLILEDL